jgi:formamidopyrimidine-DNA glycosylase
MPIPGRLPGPRYDVPELPEVETVCSGLRPRITGRRIERVDLRRADLRRPFPPGLAARLSGRTVSDVTRRAKYILVGLDDGNVLVIHLGMSGRLHFVDNGSSAGRHDHVIIGFAGGPTLVFNDARRFGLLDLVRRADMAVHPLFEGLGPEPLDPAFDGCALAAALRGRRTPIKTALLDQSVVAGVGNIYACEALFHARLSPRRLAATVIGRRAACLAATIRDVLTEAIAAGGSSLRDYIQVSGELGYFQHSFAVYDREGQPCPGCDCDGRVARIVQSGRSTFYCPRRQR